MENNLVWEPVRQELAHWAEAGRTAQLWLRDDDAVEPTDALETLLAVASASLIPVTIAVIPAFTGEALAARLSDEKGVCVAVHGWSHRNFAEPDEKKQELGSHRPVEIVHRELRDGYVLLKRLHPARFIPILVPPWNRIDGGLVPGLPALGFEMLSAYGRAKGDGPLPQLNTHLDIMDWHGTGGGRETADLASELTRHLAERRKGQDEPIGVLTHHLVHDENAWTFLAELFALTAIDPAVQWISPADAWKPRKNCSSD
ncbi:MULTISPECIES: polysaccharide deacetylase family protein [unclassified Sinorhizobium]|uniref:polysaccharide deacetylase family protein n=1 Tax=unclassified Sinorhizobium TaxID=2613772 RepID=UPI00352379C9